MNKFDNDSAKIEYNKVTFHFDWCWIKDKTIIHTGNKHYGMLWILNEEGHAVKMYGYELIDEIEK